MPIINSDNPYNEEPDVEQETTVVVDVPKQKSSVEKTKSFDTVSPVKAVPVTKEMPINPNSISKEDLVDVVRNFDWTNSTNKALNETVPYVTIKEFKLAANTYVSSIISSALLFPDAAGSNTETIQQLSNALVEKTKSSVGNETFSSFLDGIIGVAGKATDTITEGAKNLAGALVAPFTNLDTTANEWKDKDIKKNYEYLYIRKPTNRSYKFPYFNNEFFSNSNKFGNTYEPITVGEDLLAGAANFAQKASVYLAGGGGKGGIVGAAAKAAIAATEPGMYIQRPKFYEFKDTGSSVDIEFNLLNTLNEGAYEKNLEMITRLIIQNTPHRFDRLLVDPPCIYEVTIPGKAFYPYAFISELAIVHLGTKRMIGGKIIPDAFKVKMKITSLTTEVNNFYVPEMGTGGIDVNVRGKILDPSRINIPAEKKDEVVKAEVVEPAKASNTPAPQIPLNRGGSVNTGSMATSVTDKNGQTRTYFTTSGFMR
jgi:hypothetical protein